MIKNIWKRLDPSSFVFRYYLASFFGGLTFYVSVLVPFYTQWGQLNLTQIQFLQSWLMIWMFILNIPTGVFADHFGRKISVALGGLIVSASCILYVLVSGFYPFLIVEFLNALGISFVIGANTALIYDHLKENDKESESKQILGRSSAISSLGTVIAALIGGFIAANFGIRAPMFISAFPLIISSIIILTVHESKHHVDTDRPNPFDSAKKGLSFLLKSRSLQFLVANDILVWIGAYFLVWLYQPMLIKVGLAIVYFGLIRSAFSLAGMAAQFNIHVTEKLFGSRGNFFYATALIVSVSLLLIAAFPGVITVVLAIILIGGFASARTSYLNTIMNEVIPAEQRATVLSGTSMVNMLVFAIANPIVGYLADHSLRLAFVGIGVLPLVAFFLLKYSPVLKKDPASI